MNLRELRESKGISQEQLARRIDVTNRSYWRYETENHIPRLDVAKKLSVALGVSLDEIVEATTRQ